MGTNEDKEPATMGDIKVLETSLSSLESSMSSQMQELRDMLKLLVDNKISTTSTITLLSATPEVTNSLNGAPSEADTGVEEGGDGSHKTKIDGASGEHHKVPPPSVYSPDPPIPHPHIVNQGNPPALNTKAFAKW